MPLTELRGGLPRIADGIGGQYGGGNLRFITKRRHGALTVSAAELPDQRRELLRKRHPGLFDDFSQHMVMLGNRH